MTTSSIVWLVLDLTMSDGTSQSKFPHSDMEICERDMKNVEWALEDAKKHRLLKPYILKLNCVKE